MLPPARPDHTINGCVELRDITTITGLWRAEMGDPRNARDGDGRISVEDVMPVAMLQDPSCPVPTSR